MAAPDTISGLVGWWKADALPVVADGSAVSSWPDSHTSARNVAQTTSGKQPTYRTNVLNGLPVVRFDGTDDELVGTGFAALNQPVTLLAVVSGVTNRYFGTTGGAVRAGWGGGTPGQANNYAGATLTSTGTQPTGFRRITSLFNTTASLIRVNATEVASGTAGTANPGTAIALGSQTAGQYWAGDIAEIVLYNRVLSGVEIGDVEAYLYDKYFKVPVVVTGAAALVGVGTIAVAGGIRKTVARSATLAGTGAVTVATRRALGRAVALSGLGTVDVKATPTGVKTARVELLGAGLIASAGAIRTSQSRAVSISGVGSIHAGIPGPVGYETPYYVKLIAKDADGAAAPGPQGVGSPAQVNSPDIAVNAILAEHILAGSITAEKLTAVLELVTKIIAGTPGGPGLELGILEDLVGLRALDQLGVPTLTIDSETGNVRIGGLFDFGTGSHLSSDDVVEIAQQPTGQFRTPAIIDSGSAVVANATAIRAQLPAPSTTGNVMLVAVYSTGGVTHSMPSGWSLITQLASGNHRLSLWRRTTVAGGGLGPNCQLSGNSWASAQIFEVNGIANATADRFQSSTGTAPPADTGATTATSQAGTLALALFAADPLANPLFSAPTPGFEEVRVPTGAALVSYAQAVGVIGTQQCSVGLIPTGARWLGMIAAFRALPAGDPSQPDPGRVRLYSRHRSGSARPFTIDEAGRVGALLAGDPAPNSQWSSNPGGPSNSITNGTAQTIYLQRIQILEACTLTGIRYRVGNTSAGNVVPGLYSREGALLASGPDSPQPSTGAPHPVAFSAPVEVPPGFYYVALLFGSSNATFHGGQTMVDSGTLTASVALTLPGAITPPTGQSTGVPTFSTY